MSINDAVERALKQVEIAINWQRGLGKAETVNLLVDIRGMFEAMRDPESNPSKCSSTSEHSEFRGGYGFAEGNVEEFCKSNIECVIYSKPSPKAECVCGKHYSQHQCDIAKDDFPITEDGLFNVWCERWKGIDKGNIKALIHYEVMPLIETVRCIESVKPKAECKHTWREAYEIGAQGVHGEWCSKCGLPRPKAECPHCKGTGKYDYPVVGMMDCPYCRSSKNPECDVDKISALVSVKTKKPLGITPWKEVVKEVIELYKHYSQPKAEITREQVIEYLSNHPEELQRIEPKAEKDYKQLYLDGKELIKIAIPVAEYCKIPVMGEDWLFRARKHMGE